jgi:hypothetical protein
MDHFRKLLPPPPKVAQVNPIAAQGLRACTPNLEGTLVVRKMNKYYVRPFLLPGLCKYSWIL